MYVNGSFENLQMCVSWLRHTSKQTNKRTTMAENENKFIVIAHDLQTLAAMLRESYAIVSKWSNCIKK